MLEKTKKIAENSNIAYFVSEILFSLLTLHKTVLTYCEVPPCNLI